MLELSKSELEIVSGGHPVIVMAAYVAIRYAVPRIATVTATGALGGAVTGYLESDS
ncbi:MAG: hypothetical protein Q8K97_12675 [Pseudohongiella sp.]|nr:hypothetical protein [Pseudohongiella sp.]MDP2128221.1 hypothetical protein [Pseudohongiella sp.]